MNNNRIIIWGTGVIAKKFIDKINQFNQKYSSFLNQEIYIDGFIDSDPSKCGTTFYGVPVKLPQEYNLNDLSGKIIIAIKKDYEISDQLITKGFVQNTDFFSYKYFEKHNLIANSYICDVLHYLKPYGQEELYNKLKHAMTQGTWQASKNNSSFIDYINEAFSVIKKEDETDQLLQVVEEKCSTLAVLSLMGNGIADFFADLCKTFGIGNIISALDYVYDDDIAALQNDLSLKNLPVERTRVRVIGVYFPRFFNGGVERVLSLLFPMWINAGYKVVLFTDHIKESDEYSLPPSVIRVCLPKGYHAYPKLERGLMENNVDVLFIHACYEKTCYYQSLLARLLKIFTMGELHTNFTFFLESYKPLSFYVSMYSNFNQLIVLSKTDMKFWRLLGIQCKYIPNPVLKDVCPKRDNNEHPIILWVGRIDQVQKRIYDIVPIMKEVTNRIPNATLKIVGKADNAEIYSTLKEKIHEACLENNIELCGYHTNVSAFYREATIMLMTSQSMEGFPMALAESKAYGVPVVMFDMPYLELLRNRKGCITAPIGDISSLANALVEVLLDRDYLRRLSQEAIESLEKFLQFDYEKEWNNIFKALKNNQNSEISLTEEEQDYKNIIQWFTTHYSC